MNFMACNVNVADMEQQWKYLLRHASPEAATFLKVLVETHADEFARRFYEVLLKDPKASTFITHEEVEDHLSSSFRRWVTDLLTRLDEADVPHLIDEQRRIGVIHARLGISVELVLRASRYMKEAILEAIIGFPVHVRGRYRSAILAMGLVDVALEIMSAQYVASHDDATRTDEAYRNFAATMNMSLEREYQRTALSDWSNRLLQDVMIGGQDTPLSRLCQSPFGLWIRHKAPAIFTNQSELDSVRTSLETVDEELLPSIEAALVADNAADVRRLTRFAMSEIEQVRSLLDSLFDHLVRLEAGSDALTRLLNRRFLPSILGREIALARNKSMVFSVVMIDIDHFKTINDRFGHETGDRVLQHVAQILSRMTGSGDFLFRYGGEEFMIVCAELDARKAFGVAERIRQAVEGQGVELGDATHVSLTLSAGIAEYDGHPDYQHLLRSADQALYEAKAQGRNRSIIFRKDVHKIAGE